MAGDQVQDRCVEGAGGEVVGSQESGVGSPQSTVFSRESGVVATCHSMFINPRKDMLVCFTKTFYRNKGDQK